MTETTARVGAPAAAADPPAHPAWQRALTYRMTLEVASDLARQVCEIPAERDWLVVSHHDDEAALEEVITPAISCLKYQRCARRPDDPAILDTDENQRAATAYAALCATGAVLAHGCGRRARARALAIMALTVTPDGTCADLAGMVLVETTFGDPWPLLSPSTRAEAARAVTTHRQHR